ALCAWHVRHAELDVQLEVAVVFLFADDVAAARLGNAIIQELPRRLTLAVASLPAVETLAIKEDNRSLGWRRALDVLLVFRFGNLKMGDVAIGICFLLLPRTIHGERERGRQCRHDASHGEPPRRNDFQVRADDSIPRREGGRKIRPAGARRRPLPDRLPGGQSDPTPPRSRALRPRRCPGLAARRRRLRIAAPERPLSGGP